MNRLLNWFNFIGVIALATLCAVQWQQQRASNDKLQQAGSIRQHQAGEIERQQVQLAADEVDLGEFRKRITAAEKALAEQSVKLATANHLLANAAADRDVLRSSLAKWQAGVAERDAAIKELNLTVLKATADRDEAIAKYNDLIANSNNTAVAK